MFASTQFFSVFNIEHIYFSVFNIEHIFFSVFNIEHILFSVFNIEHIFFSVNTFLCSMLVTFFVMTKLWWQFCDDIVLITFLWPRVLARLVIVVTYMCRYFCLLRCFCGDSYKQHCWWCDFASWVIVLLYSISLEGMRGWLVRPAAKFGLKKKENEMGK